MRESVIQWPLGLGARDLVGAGVTAVVARLDAVVKFCEPSQSRFLEREKLVYQRLGHNHSGIVRYFGALENAVILQFASQTSIRQYLARQKKQIPLALKLRWVEQLFDAVRFIHSRNVLHGDISCNNIFLDNNLDVKLGDFAGSAIDDHPPLVCYETSHELPGEDISTMTELFALGSTVYEVMTGVKPYKELPEHEIHAAFSEGRYPDLEMVSVFSGTIMRCWSQSYTTVDEALKEVRSEVASNKELRLSLVHDLFGRPSILIPGLLTVVSLVPLVCWVRRWRLLAYSRRTLRAFTRLLGRASHNHVSAQILGWGSICAMVPVFFGLLTLVPFSMALNVTRLSSTFTIVERLINVMAHLP